MRQKLINQFIKYGIPSFIVALSLNGCNSGSSSSMTTTSSTTLTSGSNLTKTLKVANGAAPIASGFTVKDGSNEFLYLLGKRSDGTYQISKSTISNNYLSQTSVFKIGIQSPIKITECEDTSKQKIIVLVASNLISAAPLGSTTERLFTSLVDDSTSSITDAICTPDGHLEFLSSRTPTTVTSYKLTVNGSGIQKSEIKSISFPQVNMLAAGAGSDFAISGKYNNADFLMFHSDTTSTRPISLESTVMALAYSSANEKYLVAGKGGNGQNTFLRAVSPEGGSTPINVTGYPNGFKALNCVESGNCYGISGDNFASYIIHSSGSPSAMPDKGSPLLHHQGTTYYSYLLPDMNNKYINLLIIGEDGTYALSRGSFTDVNLFWSNPIMIPSPY